MTQVLVTYFSATGNTKMMAKAVVEGVRSVEGVECVLKTAGQTTNEDWLAADGIIVGSPTYFGQMASKVKRMFDITERVYGQLEGKVGAAFTTSGGAGCGHELTNMSIITAMLVSGMIVQGTTGAKRPPRWMSCLKRNWGTGVSVWPNAGWPAKTWSAMLASSTTSPGPRAAPAWAQ
jgi:NAD(P)H dehydrogenase (quinone)